MSPKIVDIPSYDGRQFQKCVARYGEILSLDQMYARDEMECNKIVVGIIKHVHKLVVERRRKLMKIRVAEVDKQGKEGKLFNLFLFGSFAVSLKKKSLKRSTYAAFRSVQVENYTGFYRGDHHDLQALLGYPRKEGAKIFLMKKLAMQKRCPKVDPPKSRKTNNEVYSYHKISELTEELVNQKVHIYGVIKAIVKAVDRSKKHAIVKVIDESCSKGEDFKVHVFYKENAIPKFAEGDIVRFHRMRIEKFYDVLDGRIFHASDMVSFPPTGEGKEGAFSTAQSYHYVDYDGERLKELRMWILSRNRPTSQINIGDITVNGTYDLTCKVKKVDMLHNILVLTVTDGTTPIYPNHMDLGNVDEVPIIIENAPDKLKAIRVNTILTLKSVEVQIMVNPVGTGSFQTTSCFKMDGPSCTYEILKRSDPNSRALRSKLKAGALNNTAELILRKNLNRGGNDSDSEHSVASTILDDANIEFLKVLGERIQDSPVETECVDNAPSHTNQSSVLETPNSMLMELLHQMEQSSINGALNTTFQNLASSKVLGNADNVQEQNKTLRNENKLDVVGSEFSHVPSRDHCHTNITNNKSTPVDSSDSHKKSHLQSSKKNPIIPQITITSETPSSNSLLSCIPDERVQVSHTSSENQNCSAKSIHMMDLQECTQKNLNESQSASSSGAANLSSCTEKNVSLLKSKEKHIDKSRDSNKTLTSTSEKSKQMKRTCDTQCDSPRTPKKTPKISFPLSPPGVSMVIESPHEFNKVMKDLHQQVLKKHCDDTGKNKNEKHSYRCHLPSQEDSVDKVMRDIQSRDLVPEIGTQNENISADNVPRIRCIVNEEDDEVRENVNVPMPYNRTTGSKTVPESSNTRHPAKGQANLHTYDSHKNYVFDSHPKYMNKKSKQQCSQAASKEVSQNSRSLSSPAFSEDVSETEIGVHAAVMAVLKRTENQVKESSDETYPEFANAARKRGGYFFTSTQSSANVTSSASQKETDNALSDCESEVVASSSVDDAEPPVRFRVLTETASKIMQRTNTISEDETWLSLDQSTSEDEIRNNNSRFLNSRLAARKRLCFNEKISSSNRRESMPNASETSIVNQKPGKDYEPIRHQISSSSRSLVQQETVNEVTNFAKKVHDSVSHKISFQQENRGTQICTPSTVASKQRQNLEGNVHNCEPNHYCSLREDSQNVSSVQAVCGSEREDNVDQVERGGEIISVSENVQNTSQLCPTSERERLGCSDRPAERSSETHPVGEDLPVQRIDVAVLEDWNFLTELKRIPGIVNSSILHIQKQKRDYTSAFLLKAWLKGLRPPVTDVKYPACKFMVGICLHCTNYYRQRYLTWYEKPSIVYCRNCQEKGDMRRLHLAFLLRCKLCDEDDNELVVNVAGSEAVNFLGCTEFSYLEDRMIYERVNKALSKLVLKEGDSLPSERGPMLRFLMYRKMTTKGLEYMVFNTFLRVSMLVDSECR